MSMIFRSIEAKKNLVHSWHRPDRPFFAAGACHILAGVFLKAYAGSDFRPFLIAPEPGFRGSHVFVADARFVFDYHGYSQRDRYLLHHGEKMRRFFSGWRGRLIELFCSPLEEDFCREYRHRSPAGYLHDPLPRALTYLRRFSRPSEAVAAVTVRPQGM
jgi:hypothetical protein